MSVVTIVRHNVKDYTTWRRVYDMNVPNRQEFGLKSSVIYNSGTSPLELVIVQEWKDVDKAREFFGLEELHDKMEQAGVTDEPDIYFLEEIDRPAL